MQKSDLILFRFVHLVFSLFLFLYARPSFAGPATSSKDTKITETVVYGPKQMRAAAQPYKVNLPAKVDAFTSYKLKIINGDGLEHDEKICNQKNIFHRFACYCSNSFHRNYKKYYRVKDLDVIVNGSKLSSVVVNKNVS